MSLSDEQLAQLTAKINSRREEWERDFDPLSRGEVRDIFEVVVRWYEETILVARDEAEDKRHFAALTAPDVKPPLPRREGYPPLRAGLARTLAEVDAEG